MKVPGKKKSEEPGERIIPKVGKKYKCSETGETYIVLGIATHTETQEKFVNYLVGKNLSIVLSADVHGENEKKREEDSRENPSHEEQSH